MNLLILNQYGVDDPSPTARLLRDMAEDLTAHGHHVQVAASSTDYRQRPARGLRRWRRELMGLMRIFWQAFTATPRPQVVLSFTSPPGLAFLGALVARWHGARAIHWALDLYPDLALALGEIPAGGVARVINGLMRWAYRHTDTVVTLDADMQARLREKGVASAIIPPWMPIRETVSLEAAPVHPPCWLYSGNLGRAHEWETLLRIQQLVEERNSTLELVIQGGGAAWRDAQAWATQQGLQRCRWREYAPADHFLRDLAHAHVLVATQRPETLGMLWPSKLAVLLRLPRPLLWIGPTSSAAAQAVMQHPGSAAFAPGQADAAAAWLLETIAKSAAHPPATQIRCEPDRQTGLESWRQLIDASG